MATGVTFNSNSLQTSSIITGDIDHGSVPDEDIRIYALGHANRSSIAYQGYAQRKVRLRGKVVGTSIANLDSLLDTFKGYFLGKDKNLDIDYNGSTRRYIATKNSLSIDRPYGLLHASFVIEFVCKEPFGRDTSTTSALSASGRTAASYVDAYTFLGTAPFQLPVITITITAVTGGTGFVKFANSTTGQAILISGQTFVAADVIVIDCENRTVTKNGVDIDFIGAFPEFPPGSQSFTYTDGFTTRTFTISVAYYKMYL